MTQLEITAIAATVSFVSLTISVMNYLRDRPNARVVVFRTAVPLESKKNETPLMSITITNSGRRPLTIHSVSYKEFWRPERVSVLPLQTRLAKRLEEGESVSDVFKKSDILPNGSWKKVAYVFATDTAGRRYCVNIAPMYKVLMFRLLSGVSNPFRRIRQMRKREDDS